MDKLKQYLEDNLMNFEVVSDYIVTIDNYGKFLFVSPKKEVMILQSFELNLSEDEALEEVDYYCFTTKKTDKPAIKILLFFIF